MNNSTPEVVYNAVLMIPEVFLLLWAAVVYGIDLITKRKSACLVDWLALVGPILTGLLSIVLYYAGVYGYGKGAGSMFLSDPMSIFSKVIFLTAAVYAIAITINDKNSRISEHRGEFFALILVSTVGLLCLSAAEEFLSLYIGLELSTIPLLILAALGNRDRLSLESTIKFVLTGMFSSALLLYGLSFMFGLAGTTDIVQMKVNLAVTQLTYQGDIGIILVLSGIALIAGLGFKLAFPPFHQWMPDVYQGSATPLSAFVAFTAITAGLVTFAKLMVNGLFAFWDPVMFPNDWGRLAALMTGLAMLYGSIMIFRQTNMKRMLAYLSIMQAGTAMVGMLAMNYEGLTALAFSIAAYTASLLGIFVILSIVEARHNSTNIDSFTGLGRTSPFLAIAMAVCLFSLAGLPPLAGFLGQYYALAAALKTAQAADIYTWLYWLAGASALSSVIVLYYCIGFVGRLFKSGQGSGDAIRVAKPLVVLVTLAILAVVTFGIFPDLILKFTENIPRSYGFIPH